MFTGIITHLGQIKKIVAQKNGKVFTIEVLIAKASQGLKLKIGDSIAINGACHTVIQIDKKSFIVESVLETLSRTNLGDLKIGDYVNLERPMKADGLFDGHIVQGHIDAVGILKKITSCGNSYELKVSAPKKLMVEIVEKGSIALEGISLTVCKTGQDVFTIAIIPHTWKITNLSGKKIGDKLNLETDVLAKLINKRIMNYVSMHRERIKN